MLICPACNASNPDDHTFCGYCGSRLERSSQDNYTLPGWLQEEDDETAAAATTSTTDDRLSDDASVDALPNEAVPTTQDTLPPWLLEDEQEATHLPQDTQPLPEHADSLQREQENYTSVPAMASVAAATESTAWQSNDTLSAEADRGSTVVRRDDRSEAYDLPPWLDDATPNDGENDTWEPPAWLAGGDTASTESGKSTVSDQRGDQNDSGVTASEDEALPDWLRAFDTPSGEARSTPPLGSPVATQEQPISPATTLTTSDHHTERDSRERDELANWLYAEQAIMDSEVTTENNEAAPEHDLPDWLREEPDAVSSSTQQAPANNEDELPDWLRDDLSVATTEASSSSAQELVEWQNNDSDVPELGSQLTESESSPQVNADQHDNSGTATSTTDTPDQASTSQPDSSSSHTSLVIQQTETADTQAVPNAEASQSHNSASNQALLPQWLEEDQKAVATAPQHLPEEPVLTPEEQAALPEWLRDEANGKSTAQAPKRQTEEDIVSILRSSTVPHQSQTGANALTTPTRPEIGASVPSVSETENTASPPQPSKRRSGALLVLVIVLVVLALVALGWWALQTGLI